MRSDRFHNRRFITRIVVTTLLLGGISCGGGGGGGSKKVGGKAIEVEGQVLGPDACPLFNALVVAAATGNTTTTSADGFFRIALPAGDERLRLDGGGLYAGYVVKIEALTADGILALEKAPGQFFLKRPLFLMKRPDGFALPLPEGSQAEEITYQPEAFPGFLLRVLAGTLVTYPRQAAEEVSVVPYPASRTPLAFPGGRSTRLILAVGESGTLFQPPLQLEIPNTEGLAAGVYADLMILDETTGTWRTAGEVVVGASGESFIGGRLSTAAVIAVLPRAIVPTTTITGTIRGSGNELLPNYRVLAGGGYCGVSGADGRFVIPDVPVPPGESLRYEVASAARFVFEYQVSDPVTPVIAGETDVGIVEVSSALRTGLPPSISYSPSTGADGVSEFTRVTVVSSTPLLLETFSVKLVRGISRKQSGVSGIFSISPSKTTFSFIPIEPLRNGESYSIFLDKRATDVEGNQVQDEDTRSTFSTTPSASEPAESARVQSAIPLLGDAGDEVRILGESFDGTSSVTFGGVEAFTTFFSTTELRVRVPEGLAGAVPLRVGGAGDLEFSAEPSLDDIINGTAALTVGEARTVEGLGTQLGSSPLVGWNGVQSGIGFSGTDRDFSVSLPAGVDGGYLGFEVDGLPTRGFFVRVDRPADGVPPAAEEVLLPATSSDPVRVRFAEFIDERSRARLLADNVEIDLPAHVFLHGDDGKTILEVRAPEGGLPVGPSLVFVLNRFVLDLAGNPFDADPDAEGAQPLRVPFVLTE